VLTRVERASCCHVETCDQKWRAVSNLEKCRSYSSIPSRRPRSSPVQEHRRHFERPALSWPKREGPGGYRDAYAGLTRMIRTSSTTKLVIEPLSPVDASSILRVCPRYDVRLSVCNV